MRAPCVRCDFLLERLPSDSLSDSGFRRRRAFPYLGQLARTSCLPWSRPPRRLLPPRAQNSELAAHTTRTTRNITTTHTLRLKLKRNHTHTARCGSCPSLATPHFSLTYLEVLTSGPLLPADPSRPPIESSEPHRHTHLLFTQR